MGPTPPSPARIYDYYLGGKDNCAADRQAAEHVLTLIPEARAAARANRRFLVRVVRYLAGLGVDQFIDLGTGIPTSPNVHEVARETHPRARVVYVDNDPVVTAHNKALRSTHDGVISVDMDIRAGRSLREQADVRGLIDFDRPVGVLMLAVLHLLGAEEARATLDGIRGWLPEGGYLALSAATTDGMDDQQVTELAGVYEKTGSHPTGVTRADVLRAFAGFEMVPPGVTSLGKWRADEEDPENLSCLCGLGRFTPAT